MIHFMNISHAARIASIVISFIVISCIPFLMLFCDVNGVNGETPARVYAYMRVYMRAYVRICNSNLYISLSYRITVVTVVSIRFSLYLCSFLW